MDIQQTPASVIIFAATLGISLYAMYGKSRFYESWALHPFSVMHQNKYYQVITHAFIHADFVHLIFNMMTFYFFAFTLELMVGSANFVIIYFASLILSSISTIIKNKDNDNYSAVGASGAISGVLFSYILFFPTSTLGIFLLPIGIPAPIFGLLYLAYCYYAAKKSRDQINHEAHLWGAVAGLIVTIFLIPGSLSYFLSQLPF